MKPHRGLRNASDNIELKQNIEDMDFNVERCSNLLSSILDFHEKKEKIEFKNDNKNNLAHLEKKNVLLKKSTPKPTIKQPINNKKTNFILSNKQQINSSKATITPANTTNKPAKQHKSILKKCNSKSNELLNKFQKSSRVTDESISSFSSITKMKSKSTEDLKTIQKESFSDILPSNAVYIKVIEQLLKRLQINSKEATHMYLKTIMQDHDFKGETGKTIDASDKALVFDEHPIKLKLDEMSLELNDLKKELNIDKSPKKTTGNVLPKNLNTLVEQKLIQMKKQIVDLTDLQRGQQNSLQKTQISSPTSVAKEEMLLKLKRELSDSNHRCQKLEHSLQQKEKQTNQYFNLFSEISENVNRLAKDFECKKERLKPFKASRLDYVNKKKIIDSSDIQANILSLKQKLVKFQTKIKDQYASEVLRKKTDKLKSNRFESYYGHVTHDSSTTASKTASDTLIDADSSFQSLDSGNFLNQNKMYDNHSARPFQKFSIQSKNFFGTRNGNGLVNISALNKYEDYGEDEDDEEDGIQIAMDDFTITTIATSDLETDSDDGTESEDEGNKFADTDIDPTEDYEFQKDLLQLDQKISKVKQTLESMKSI